MFPARASRTKHKSLFSRQLLLNGDDQLILWPWWASYSCGAVTSIATLMLRFAFGPQVDHGPALILFSIPIVLTAYLGAVGPGLAATAFSALLASYFLLPPLYSFRIDSTLHRLDLLALIVSGVAISLITGKLHELLQTVRLVRMRLWAILNSAMDAIITVNEDQQVLFFNPAAEQVFRCTAPQVLGSDVNRFVPLPLQGRHRKDIKEFASSHVGSRRMTASPANAVRSTGDLFPMEASISQVRVNGDRMFNVILRDVTEKAMAEQQLRQLKERFAKAFHNNPLAMTISTVEDGRYIDCNQAFLSMTGWDRSLVIGRTPFELGLWTHQDERGQLLRDIVYSERILGDRIMGVSTSFRTASGEAREANLSAEDIEIGNTRCVLEIIQDVTETKQLERQLLQAQKMEAIGRLAAGVAHDLNNILSVIIGRCDLARETQSSADTNIEQIRRAGERASTLVQQLLAFGQKRAMQARVLNLNDVVARLTAMLSRAIGKNIVLFFRPTEGIGRIRGDAALIEQALLNIVVNARDAMPAGGKITIESRNEMLDGGRGARVAAPYVLLSVSDTGCGMDENIKSRIFEPFFTTKEVGKGTGLGLASVYGIIKQHGGAIAVDSEIGKGTTFKLYFPLVTEAAEKIPQPATPIRSMPETVLIVEDEEDLRDLTATILQNAGYKVLQAESGREALDLMRRNPERIDILVTDFQMPGMSGVELVSQVREIGPIPKVLYMSGCVGEIMERPEFKQCGGHLIGKPFTHEELLDKVREVLGAPFRTANVNL